jgi:hypothetical protein
VIKLGQHLPWECLLQARRDLRRSAVAVPQVSHTHYQEDAACFYNFIKGGVDLFAAFDAVYDDQDAKASAQPRLLESLPMRLIVGLQFASDARLSMVSTLNGHTASVSLQEVAHVFDAAVRTSDL